MQPLTDRLCQSRSHETRRGFLRTAVAAVFGAVAAGAARAQQALERPRTLSVEGESLHTRVSLGDPPVEPLDTMIHFRRSDNNTGRAMTHEILSLTHEEKGPNSYPWTIYSHLDTHHEVGDACVLCSRIHKYGPGWSSGLHSEVFNHNRAVSIGVNVEMGNDYEGKDPTQIIGVNVQAVGPKPADQGIHIHDGNGRFLKAILVEGACDVAVDIQGEHKVGIDTNGSEIHTGGGALKLDSSGEVGLAFRNGRIEFVRGSKCLAFIRVDGSAEREI